MHFLETIKKKRERERESLFRVGHTIELLIRVLHQASEVTTHPSNLSETSAVLIFSVQDVNDNTPTFSKNEWHGYVQEDVTDTIISIPGNLTVADFDQVNTV